jgi:hypothetical protein
VKYGFHVESHTAEAHCGIGRNLNARKHHDREELPAWQQTAEPDHRFYPEWDNEIVLRRNEWASQCLFNVKNVVRLALRITQQ